MNKCYTEYIHIKFLHHLQCIATVMWTIQMVTTAVPYGMFFTSTRSTENSEFAKNAGAYSSMKTCL